MCAEGLSLPALKSVIGVSTETVRKLTHHTVTAVHFFSSILRHVNGR